MTGTPWHFRPDPHPRILPVPAFQDNYIWLLLDAQQASAAVIDPGDAPPVLEALASRGLRLAHILVTHHHADHVGGLPALKAAFPDARVHGPVNPRIGGIDHRVGDGDTVKLDGFDATFRVLAVPGHTLDHIAFHSVRIGQDPRPVLFCGDTLFAGGCGRLFEGAPEQMMASLATLAALPAETLVYCAHEYTLSNLRFARAAEPDNGTLAEREREAIALRERGIETVPSSIGIERATNPFLRWDSPTIRAQAQARTGAGDPSATDTFAAVRQWKNDFRA
jgi:hydroxyacylglutathione hydrolase